MTLMLSSMPPAAARVLRGRVLGAVFWFAHIISLLTVIFVFHTELFGPGEYFLHIYVGPNRRLWLHHGAGISPRH